MAEHVYPNELEIHKAIDDEVAPGVAYPKILHRDPGQGEGRRALEPVPPRRPLRPRADQLGVRDPLRADGPQPRRRADGLQLRRARHGEHGDPRRARHRRAARALPRPAARGRDAQLLLDDRARGLRLGPDHAPDPGRPRGRRVGHQRAQVVHLGRRRRGLRDRDGRHRPRRRAVQPRLDDPGADRQPRLQPRPPRLGDGPRRRARPLRDPLRGLRRARVLPARRARRRLRRRPGPPRPRPHPPLHARDRHRRARDRDDVRARQHPPRLRRPARRQAVHPGVHRHARGWRSNRPACSA